MSRKTYLSVATVLFCSAAILAGLYSTTVMRYAWGMWYGNHINWNDLDVQISSNEYFMPMAKSGKLLIIADLKANDALILLHAETRTREFQKSYVDNLCQPTECRMLNEQSYTVNGRRVDSFSNVKTDANSNLITYHQYLVIEGGRVWVEFSGDESQYMIHKSTIDSIVQQISA